MDRGYPYKDFSLFSQNLQLPCWPVQLSLKYTSKYTIITTELDNAYLYFIFNYQHFTYYNCVKKYVFFMNLSIIKIKLTIVMVFNASLMLFIIDILDEKINQLLLIQYSINLILNIYIFKFSCYNCKFLRKLYYCKGYNLYIIYTCIT